MKIFKKKPKIETSVKSFFPCEMIGCRLHGEWTKIWNKNEAIIYVSSEGRKIKDSDILTTVNIAIWCMSCVHFRKQNNFIKGE